MCVYFYYQEFRNACLLSYERPTSEQNNGVLGEALLFYDLYSLYCILFTWVGQSTPDLPKQLNVS